MQCHLSPMVIGWAAVCMLLIRGFGIIELWEPLQAYVVQPLTKDE